MTDSDKRTLRENREPFYRFLQQSFEDQSKLCASVNTNEKRIEHATRMAAIQCIINEFSHVIEKQEQE